MEDDAEFKIRANIEAATTVFLPESSASTEGSGVALVCNGQERPIHEVGLMGLDSDEEVGLMGDDDETLARINETLRATAERSNQAVDALFGAVRDMVRNRVVERGRQIGRSVGQAAVLAEVVRGSVREGERFQVAMDALASRTLPPLPQEVSATVDLGGRTITLGDEWEFTVSDHQAINEATGVGTYMRRFRAHLAAESVRLYGTSGARVEYMPMEQDDDRLVMRARLHPPEALDEFERVALGVSQRTTFTVEQVSEALRQYTRGGHSLERAAELAEIHFRAMRAVHMSAGRVVGHYDPSSYALEDGDAMRHLPNLVEGMFEMEGVSPLRGAMSLADSARLMEGVREAYGMSLYEEYTDEHPTQEQIDELLEHLTGHIRGQGLEVEFEVWEVNFRRVDLNITRALFIPEANPLNGGGFGFGELLANADCTAPGWDARYGCSVEPPRWDRSHVTIGELRYWAHTPGRDVPAAISPTRTMIQGEFDGETGDGCPMARVLCRGSRVQPLDVLREEVDLWTARNEDEGLRSHGPDSHISQGTHAWWVASHNGIWPFLREFDPKERLKNLRAWRPLRGVDDAT